MNHRILGAIIGDVVGSTREWKNIKTEEFELLPQGSRFTDDTVITLAVAEWLMTDPTHSKEILIECMQRLDRRYPGAGYGGMFRQWLREDSPKPYNSFGNGSAMRVGPVGLYANSLEEALELAPDVGFVFCLVLQALYVIMLLIWPFINMFRRKSKSIWKQSQNSGDSLRESGK